MNMTKLDLDREDTVHHLDVAISSLMALRVVIGGTPDDAPLQALDRALAGDPDFQRAKQDAQRAWEPIVETAQDQQAAFRAEEAVNHMAAEACRVGWALAIVVVAGRLEGRGDGPGSRSGDSG